MPPSKNPSKPATRKVRVNEQKHQTRTFVEEEPIESNEDVFIVEDEETPPDPLVEFLRSIDNERNVTMHVFILPSYPNDGKAGGRGIDRAYVTSFEFTADETETFRGRVQYCYPQGGMFQFELKEKGVILKKWHEKISPAPGHEPEKKSAYPFPPPPVINIKQNETKPEPAPNPVAVIKEQLATMKEMVGVVKELMPPAPIVNVGETGNNNSSNESATDRLLETVLIKALESGKTSADKVFEYLSNGRRGPTGFMDSLGPVLAEIAKAVAPAIGMGVQQYIRAAAAGQGQPVTAAAPAEGTNPQQIAAAPLEPSERAWRRVVQRMLEDCFEHVQIRAASAVDGIHTTPSANAIVDLLDRFPDQLTQMVQMLLSLPPDEVFDMCAMLQPNQQMADGVLALKQFPAALNWLIELQTETKQILSESEGDTNAEV